MKTVMMFSEMTLFGDDPFGEPYERDVDSIGEDEEYMDNFG